MESVQYMLAVNVSWNTFAHVSQHYCQVLVALLQIVFVFCLITLHTFSQTVIIVPLLSHDNRKITSSVFRLVMIQSDGQGRGTGLSNDNLQRVAHALVLDTENIVTGSTLWANVFKSTKLVKYALLLGCERRVESYGLRAATFMRETFDKVSAAMQRTIYNLR